jgi:hypothetical protein
MPSPRKGCLKKEDVPSDGSTHSSRSHSSKMVAFDRVFLVEFPVALGDNPAVVRMPCVVLLTHYNYNRMINQLDAIPLLYRALGYRYRCIGNTNLKKCTIWIFMSICVLKANAETRRSYHFPYRNEQECKSNSIYVHHFEVL